MYFYLITKDSSANEFILNSELFTLIMIIICESMRGKVRMSTKINLIT